MKPRGDGGAADGKNAGAAGELRRHCFSRLGVPVRASSARPAFEAEAEGPTGGPAGSPDGVGGRSPRWGPGAERAGVRGSPVGARGAVPLGPGAPARRASGGAAPMGCRGCSPGGVQGHRPGGIQGAQARRGCRGCSPGGGPGGRSPLGPGGSPLRSRGRSPLRAGSKGRQPLEDGTGRGGGSEKTQPQPRHHPAPTRRTLPPATHPAPGSHTP